MRHGTLGRGPVDGNRGRLWWGRKQASRARSASDRSCRSPAGAAFLGDPMLKSLQLYVERINAAGGVNGRRLELIHYDDGSDAAKANAFARRLIESDRVDLIIGPTSTGSTMSMVPLVERAHVPLLSLAGAVVIVDPVRKWVFKIPTSDRMAVERVFQDMQRRGITRVALLVETGGFGQSGAKEAEATAGKYGITLVRREEYGQKDSDVTPQLTRLRNAPGVQAVFVIGFGQGAVMATRNYHQLGIKLPLYHAHGVASDEFIRLSGAAAEGVRLPSPALLVAERLPPTRRSGRWPSTTSSPTVTATGRSPRRSEAMPTTRS